MITDKPFCAYMMHALIETLPTLNPPHPSQDYWVPLSLCMTGDKDWPTRTSSLVPQRRLIADGSLGSQAAVRVLVAVVAASLIAANYPRHGHPCTGSRHRRHNFSGSRHNLSCRRCAVAAMGTRRAANRGKTKKKGATHPFRIHFFCENSNNR